jgi:Tol biopolymer transport system component
VTPEYSRDGHWLTYTNLGNIYAARTSGDTAQREVAASPATELNPTISPDGRWIAYSATEALQEIFVRPFPDAQTTRWQVSTGGGSVPRWGRDGKELFYVRPNGDLVAVPVLPGAVFAAGIPTVLFSSDLYRASDPLYMYDVHPDGKRFLMLREVGTILPDQLVLLENLPQVLASGGRAR